MFHSSGRAAHHLRVLVPVVLLKPVAELVDPEPQAFAKEPQRQYATFRSHGHGKRRHLVPARSAKIDHLRVLVDVGHHQSEGQQHLVFTQIDPSQVGDGPFEVAAGANVLVGSLVNRVHRHLHQAVPGCVDDSSVLAEQLAVGHDVNQRVRSLSADVPHEIGEARVYGRLGNVAKLNPLPFTQLAPCALHKSVEVHEFHRADSHGVISLTHDAADIAVVGYIHPEIATLGEFRHTRTSLFKRSIPSVPI